ncbi:MAG: hypothetical protein R6U51_01745 [Anaerolineales bacterium]
MFVICFSLFTVLGVESAQSLFSDPPDTISDSDPLVEESLDPDTGEEPFLLLIQVDELEGEAAVLESVWLLGYGGQDGDLLFFPLLPSQAGDGKERDQDLRAAFQIQDGGRPSSGFFNLLRDRNLDWSGYLLIDQKGLESILRSLESGKGVDGALSFLDSFPAWGSASTGRGDDRIAQARFILSTCEKAAGIDSSEFLGDMFTRYANHLILEGTSLPDLNQIWEPIVGGDGACQFPTLGD